MRRDLIYGCLRRFLVEFQGKYDTVQLEIPGLRKIVSMLIIFTEFPHLYDMQHSKEAAYNAVSLERNFKLEFVFSHW